jgi:hypothetical protein
MNKQIMTTKEKIMELATKYLAPKEEAFKQLIMTNYPDAGEGIAMMAAFLSQQLEDDPQTQHLSDALFNFMCSYLVTRDLMENDPSINPELN